MAVAGALTRRALLAGLTLAGCAPLRHGALPPSSGGPVLAPNRLRIVIFEMAGPDVPFHTGLIVHAGAETLLYDPAGRWHPEGQCRPEGEVIHDLTPADEEAYLDRSGIRYSLGGWVTHVFDTAVSAEVARLAMRRAEDRPASLPLHCAHNVSSLLAGLPGFEGLHPHRITADLLNDLLARDDLVYSRRTGAASQSG